MSLQSIIQQIKSATFPGENTALRVGSALEQMDAAKRDKSDSLSASDTIDMINAVKILATTGTPFLGTIEPTTVIPTGNFWAFAGEGTYPNAGGVIVGAGEIAIITRVGTTFDSIILDVPVKSIQEISKIATVGLVDTYRIYYTDGSTPTDFEVTNGASSDMEKVPFSNVILFDKKRKFSTVNQFSNINFSYNSSGLLTEAMYKIELISDGVSDISFSNDFDVNGEVDKDKNQVIYFTKQSVVEFKIAVYISNVAKSGQITPIDLDADAQIYYNKIIAAGGTMTNNEILAMNNFYVSAKTNGYFGKIRGLYLILGNNTSARLVNGINNYPNATMTVGTVSNDGIVGVLNTNMKPSDVMLADSFSYGLHNTTVTYDNKASAGCNTTTNSGIFFCITGTNAQCLFSGTKWQVFASVSNPDSLGSYVVSRTSLSIARLFKNGALKYEHTVSQTGGSMPDINFVLGGNNDIGTIYDDSRTSKYGFIGLGLTDSEAIAIDQDLNNLMLAIGR